MTRTTFSALAAERRGPGFFCLRLSRNNRRPVGADARPAAIGALNQGTQYIMTRAGPVADSDPHGSAKNASAGCKFHQFQLVGRSAACLETRSPTGDGPPEQRLRTGDALRRVGCDAGRPAGRPGRSLLGADPPDPYAVCTCGKASMLRPPGGDLDSWIRKPLLADKPAIAPAKPATEGVMARDCALCEVATTAVPLL